MEIPGYKIHKEIGNGGMSTVYLATQESFGRQVALKILFPTFASNKDFAARFLREAKIIAGFSHPHIVPVYDVGRHGELHYMSMDYLTGGHLLQWIERGLDIEEILQIIEDVASALSYAHNKGYIHRDIKPDNILFREDHSPVLTDFGISRLQNANDQITLSGSAVGTPKYMSPEVLQGKKIDGRSDIYSLGIVFYEMLMKKPPYMAEEYMALGLKHIQDPIPVLPKHYARFQPLLEKCIAKNPDDRYRNGLELMKAIQALKSGRTPSASVLPDSSSQNMNIPGQDIQRQSVLQQEHDFALADTVDVDSLRVGDFALQPVAPVKVPPKITPNVASRSIPDPALVRKTTAVRSNNRPPEKTVYGEEVHKKALIFERCIFTCDMTIYDANSFSVLFSSMTNKLLEWSQDRGSKASGFRLRLVSTPDVFYRAKKMMDSLCEGEGAYDFIKKLQVALVMENVDDHSVDLYAPDINE